MNQSPEVHLNLVDGNFVFPSHRVLGRKPPSSPGQGSVASLQQLLLLVSLPWRKYRNLRIGFFQPGKKCWCWCVKSCHEERCDVMDVVKASKVKAGQPGPCPLLIICTQILIGNLRVRYNFHLQGGLLKSSQSAVIVKLWKQQRQSVGTPRKN